MFKQSILMRKMRRDISNHKTQFLSIFLMAFLAVFIYAGVGGEWRGLEKSADNFYEETNIADVFMMSESFSDDETEKISDVDGVLSLERRTIIDASVQGIVSENISPESQNSNDNKSTLSLIFTEKNEISKTYLVEGEEFDVDDKNGIWVSKRFTDANDLVVGDKISLALLDQKIEKEIKGIVYSSEYVYNSEGDGMAPNFKESGYAYISWKAFPVPEMFEFTEILIKAKDTTGLEKKIDKAINGEYSVYYEREDHPSVSVYSSEITQHKMMGDVFPIVFLLVALLTIMTTMTRIVRSQRTQIGTLRALGFKKKTILGHYVSYGFYLSLFGGLLGCIVGPLTLPHLFYPSMSGFYTLPEWGSAFHYSFVLIALIVVAACTLVTYIACSKYINETPAQTLRPKSPKVSKHSFVEKTKMWTKIGFNTQWNFRDARRNKIRSIMAVVGVLGCTALLSCAFGMNDSMKIIKEWQYSDIYNFESKMNLEEGATLEQIERILNETNGEKLMETGIEIRVDETKKAGNLTVTDGNDLISTTDKNRKEIILPKGKVSISKKMAELLDIEVGDKVEWHLYGSEKWVESEIAAIFRDPSTQGLMMDRETFEKYGYEYVPTSIISSDTVDEKFPGVSGVMSISDIKKGWDEFTEAMMTMVYVLMVGAAVLSIVVLYNLGILSFMEKERDMATLKVMGLKTKKLRTLLLTQNIWFSVIGFVIGLPIGLFLIELMVSSSGESFDFPVELTFTNFTYSLLITFGLSIFTSLLFSNRIKRINMVESLKGQE